MFILLSLFIIFMMELLKKQTRTRYFVFSRVNPRYDDYELLVETCDRIDACLGYKTVRDGWKVRLIGFLILRGPSTIEDDLGRLFPNFLLTPLGHEFHGACDWLASQRMDDGHWFIDAEPQFNNKEHPFEMLRVRLFNDKP